MQRDVGFGTGGVRNFMTDAAMTKKVRVEITSLSDKGTRRENNEDSVVVVRPAAEEEAAEGILLAVADGLGGHSDGEVASGVATEELTRAYYEGVSGDPSQRLRDAIDWANRCVFEGSHDAEHQPGMATTIVVAVIREGKLLVGNVGDSRAYLLRAGDLRQLTQDHCLGQNGLFWGLACDTKTRRSYALYKALGAEEEVHPSISECELSEGDLVLLCTDGLSDALTDAEIRDILLHQEPERAVRSLVAAANEEPVGDNVTVVIAAVSVCSTNTRGDQETGTSTPADADEQDTPSFGNRHTISSAK